MSETLEPLVRDLVQWCDRQPRAYVEALEAWRTNCPRLMVWEAAVERGLVATVPTADGLCVLVTAAGRRWLDGLPGRAAAIPGAPAVAVPL